MQITDVKGLAKILGIPASSIMRYARVGKLPSLRIGKHLRFDIAQCTKNCKDTNGRSS